MTESPPLPVPDEQSTPFWEAAARGTLVLPRCTSCDAYTLPPEPVCPRCSSPEPDWTFRPVSGRGIVRSRTVVRQSFLPGIEVPFVLVDVELVEQTDLRLVGRLVDGPDAAAEAGAEVVTEFVALGPELSLPVFRLEAGT